MNESSLGILFGFMFVLNLIATAIHALMLSDNKVDIGDFLKKEETFFGRLNAIFFIFMYNNSRMFTTKILPKCRLPEIYDIYNNLNLFGKFVFLCDQKSVIGEVEERSLGYTTIYETKYFMKFNFTGVLFFMKFFILPFIPLVHSIILVYRIVFVSHNDLKYSYDLTSIIEKKKPKNKSKNSNLNQVYK